MTTTHNAVPGSDDYRGLHDGADANWSHLHYSVDEVIQHAPAGAPQQPTQDRSVDWYDWRGLGDQAGVQAFADALAVPPLALEDARDIYQRPKFEERPGSALVVIPYLEYDAERHELLREHVTLYWTDTFLLSLQEYPDDLFAGLRERIEGGMGRVRKRDTDYLGYALADVIVDGYGDVIAGLEPIADDLENDILNGKDLNRAKRAIHQLKGLLNQLRAVVVPARDAVAKWTRGERASDSSSLRPFLQDLSDNLARVHDLTEILAARTNDLYQLYSSELAVGTNQVVQVLTVVSTIFIPLTFLTGLYGMNFEYIPELGVRYGYFILWAVMIAVTAGLLIYFRRKGWL